MSHVFLESISTGPGQEILLHPEKEESLIYPLLEEIVLTGDPERLLELERRITSCKEQGLLPFNPSVQARLRHAFIVARYSLFSNIPERLAIIDRLEALTGIIEDPNAMRVHVTQTLSQNIIRSPEAIGDYLDYVMPLFLENANISQREWIYSSAQRCLETLAKLGDKNPSFLEQVEAFKKWDLFRKDYFCEYSSRYYGWIGSQVAAKGLSFSPRFAERELQCFKSVNYSRYLSAFYQRCNDFPEQREDELSKMPPEEASFERLADRVGIVHGRGDLRKTLAALVAVPASPEEKLRLFLCLLDHRGFFRLVPEFRSTEIPTGPQVTEYMPSYIKTLSQLGLSEEQQEEAMQSVYALYIEKEWSIPDGLLMGTATPIDWSHPIIQAACERSIRGILSKNSDLIFTATPTHQRPPILLPFDEGSPMFQRELHEKYPSSSLEFTVKFSTIERRPEELKQLLSKVFKERYFSGPEVATQWVLRYPQHIADFCWEDIGFSDLYQNWLATYLGRGCWSLATVKDRPGSLFPDWSSKTYHVLVDSALAASNWALLTELMALVPDRAPELQRLVTKGIEENLPVALTDREGEQVFMEHVLTHYQDVLKRLVNEDPDSHLNYQFWIASMLTSGQIEGILERAPCIETDHRVIQHAIAKQLLDELVSDGVSEEFLEEHKVLNEAHAQMVDWENADLREDIRGGLHHALMIIGGLYASNPGEALVCTRALEKYTGYRLTDLRHWVPQWDTVGQSGMTLIGYIADLEAWNGLEKVCGSEPGERERLCELVREAINQRCVAPEGDPGRVEDFLKLKRQFGIQPSEEALRTRFALKIQRSGDPGDSLELLSLFGVSLAFTPEQILELPPASARTEAFFAMTLLPKGGPERVAAEKALRGRSWLATLMPQLLAIQSPARRAEFCPYQQELPQLLEIFHTGAVDIDEKDRPKALLFFVQRFGMQYLPRLASIVMPLFLETRNGRFPVNETDSQVLLLRHVMGITDSNTHLSFEEYLTRIQETMTSIREAILEDRPVPPHIQQSELGMEFFNAVVPHTGTYQSVEDRSALLATVSQSSEELRKDEMYVPSTKLVRIVDVHSESLIEEDASLVVQRGIRLRREQQERKYQEEELQRYLGKWEQASVLLRQESTGASRAFWFSFLAERSEARSEALTKKLAKLTHQIAIERMNKELAQIATFSDRVTTLIKNDSVGTPEELLEELQSLYVNSAGKIDRVALESEAGDIARALTLVIMETHSPLHQQIIQATRTAAEDQRKTNAGLKSVLIKEQIDAWTALFEEEYLEHFAGLRSQSQVPLSEVNRRLLQKLWRIDGLEQSLKEPDRTSTKSIGHPIVDAMTTVRRLEQEILALEQQGIVYEEKQVGFWPVKGIGRALAGDIADACYNGYREELASGDYPGITAILFTVPGHKEIAGSVLFIDTKTLSGRRVLVIRALNPTDSVTRRLLDSRSFVLATIEYAKEIAIRTKGTSEPIEEIRICYDHRGGHSTNREEIFEAESELHEKYDWEQGEELENTDETNFNNYEIYEPQETRVVWRAKTFEEFLEAEEAKRTRK